MKDYSKSIIAFKKVLQYSWYSKNVEGEMMAYEYLAVQYFYMGNLERCKFYHNRSMAGESKQ